MAFGGKRGALYQYYFTRNGLLCIEQHSSLPLLVPRMALFLWNARARARRLAQTPQEQIALSRATVRGIADYVRRRFGQGRAHPVVSRRDA